MIRRPPRSTLSSSSAASDVYKRQGNFSALYERLTNFDAFVVANHENFVEHYVFANFAIKFFNFDNVAFGNTVLFTACLYDCEHNCSFLMRAADNRVDLTL
eukprot:TRINITY_DN156_c0_g1_i2.p1 TRINITY_DN156_c0_g1~~TRINITY_DN156_c0_g1_i2.p1  ORF type:complete len:101 (-),score=6.12 TRINITY_DN156_c0_g1_i2:105-407(-)